MVEVFATNIYSLGQAKSLEVTIAKRFPTYIVNFDLEDCDRILRVENQSLIESHTLAEIASSLSIVIRVLEDS
ncbi:hypothetical protein MM239_08500 [Belliella sp. DSM 111904]|uniref:Uncharacterized protein n=1 Tax=Belliella filtrata TaxID=2923435 RepID=A0ABS9UZ40_9BACT|nr:hypothetical protein [Belliella filtrata]MCH7409431.1 hypothetical protein [Belliella filtrata]